MASISSIARLGLQLISLQMPLHRKAMAASSTPLQRTLPTLLALPTLQTGQSMYINSFNTSYSLRIPLHSFVMRTSTSLKCLQLPRLLTNGASLSIKLKYTSTLTIPQRLMGYVLQQYVAIQTSSFDTYLLRRHGTIFYYLQHGYLRKRIP
jgi:hypothetical protein